MKWNKLPFVVVRLSVPSLSLTADGVLCRWTFPVQHLQVPMEQIITKTTKLGSTTKKAMNLPAEDFTASYRRSSFVLLSDVVRT